MQSVTVRDDSIWVQWMELACWLRQKPRDRQDLFSFPVRSLAATLLAALWFRSFAPVGTVVTVVSMLFPDSYSLGTVGGKTLTYMHRCVEESRGGLSPNLETLLITSLK